MKIRDTHGLFGMWTMGHSSLENTGKHWMGPFKQYVQECDLFKPKIKRKYNKQTETNKEKIPWKLVCIFFLLLSVSFESLNFM